jgi:hypothetical protein
MMTPMEKQEAEANAANDPYHDLRTIRLLSLILIALGLLVCLYVTAFTFSYYGRPRRLIEVGFLLIPYLYLFSFFLCCLRGIQGRVLAVLCITFNLPLVLFIVYALINLSFVGIVLSIFPVMWILLCRERLKFEGGAPPNNSFNRTR